MKIQELEDYLQKIDATISIQSFYDYDVVKYIAVVETADGNICEITGENDIEDTLEQLNISLKRFLDND